MAGKRHRIREAVVQLLYAAGAGDPPMPGGSPSLRLLLEPLEESATRARAKAHLHLQQGRDNWLAGLDDLVHRLAHIESTDCGDTSLAPVRDLFNAESAIHECLEALQRELNGNKSAANLAAQLADTRLHNQASRAAAARLHQARPDFPALATIREEALALVKNLPRYSERAEMALAEPPGELPELAPCRKIQNELTATREAVTAYTDAIDTHLDDLNARIEAAVENYTPERIDRIDRAILRLATYELLHAPDLPPAVVINEAIELARSFGTTDSPRFVNGVLDRIRKASSENPSEPPVVSDDSGQELQNPGNL